MKKIILTFFAVLFLSVLSMAQDKEKNYAYCKKVIESQRDVSVVTTFSVNQSISGEDFTSLSSMMFRKSSIYNVVINERRNQIRVFHLSEVSYEDIKMLIGSSGIELNFILTENVHFGKIVKQ